MNRRIVLTRRPHGMPVPDDFVVENAEVPRAEEGQVVVRNLFLSIDPAIRGWMSGSTRSYLPPIPVGGVVRSAAVGLVIESRHPDWEPGDRIVGLTGWEMYSAVSPRHARRLGADFDLPLSRALTVAGGAGLTAYFGLLDVGRAKAGDTVLVSAAAGGVGSLVGQIARIQGCRTVGIAGGAEKCAWLTEELGFDAAVDYKAAGFRKRLLAACADGVDVFFDNVGGEVLDTGLLTLNRGGRVVLCGAISQLNATAPVSGPANYLRLISHRATMQGFITLDYADRWDAAVSELSGWLRSGQIHHREHLLSGLDQTVEGFLGIFRGDNRGKVIVQL